MLRAHSDQTTSKKRNRAEHVLKTLVGAARRGYLKRGLIGDSARPGPEQTGIVMWVGIPTFFLLGKAA